MQQAVGQTCGIQVEELSAFPAPIRHEHASIDCSQGRRDVATLNVLRCSVYLTVVREFNRHDLKAHRACVLSAVGSAPHWLTNTEIIIIVKSK